MPSSSASSGVPDGGWGWCVVGAFFLISVIMDGIRYSFGIMYIELLEAFGGGRGETAWIGSIMVGTTNIVGPVAGKLTDKFGCRAVAIGGALTASAGYLLSIPAHTVGHLYFTFGFLSGIGCGMLSLTSMVSLSRHFDKRRSLAMGLAVSGSGVGAFIFNPLTKWLLDEYGWRGTVLIQAGLLLNCAVLGSLYRPVQNKAKTAGNQDPALNGYPSKNDPGVDIESTRSLVLMPIPNGDCEKDTGIEIEMDRFLPSVSKEVVGTDGLGEKRGAPQCWRWLKFPLLKDLDFLIFLLSSFILTLAYNVPYTFLPDLAVDTGFSKDQGVWLISILGMANTISRLVYGWVADKRFVDRPTVYNVTLTVAGVFTGLCPLYTSYPLLVMYAVSFGVTVGGYVSLSVLVLSDLFSVDTITESVGLFMCACGVASYIGSPVAGWLFDGTGSYHMTFIVTGAEFALGGLILFVISCHRYGRNKRSRSDDS